MARKALLNALLVLLLALVGVAPARAAGIPFDLMSFSGTVATPGGTLVTQAGAHPDVSTNIQLTSDTDANGNYIATGNVKDVSVDLPAGLVGNPTVSPTCPTDLLNALPSPSAQCPVDTQVGVVLLTSAYFFGPSPVPFPPVALYNVTPPPGVAARFGFNVLGVVVVLDATLTSAGGYHITVASRQASQSIALTGIDVHMWGVPADPVHDAERYDPVTTGYGMSSSLPRRAFMSTPTTCSSTPLTTSVRLNSWQQPDRWLTASFDHDVNDAPLIVDGCDKLPFAPSITLRPSKSTAGAPTGLDVNLTIPQSDDPDGLATANLKDARVTLPEGMAINPSSAGGLQACTDAEFGLGSDDAVRCPDASRLGSVEAMTPLLSEGLTGSIYVRSQASNDPESGDMFRLAMVLENQERGVLVKLPGQIHASRDTGRLVATFDDNPQLPVSELTMKFKGGQRAPLVNPSSCGSKPIVSEFTSWGGQKVERDDTYDVTGCGEAQFKPTLDAGLVNPVAGSSSSFVLRLQRSDADNEMKTVSTSLPPGLIGKVAGVPLCADAAAAAGACPAGSQIGRVEVGAGAGSNPFYVRTGKVFLTQGYKGAPFGLDFAVPAVAGPFDLGLVNVRAALNVDKTTAQVSVAADPMPRIVQGVPLLVKDLRVIIDRDGFMQAPTSCDPMQIGTTVGSYSGDTANLANGFQVAGCGSLRLAPKMAMRLTNKTQTKDGKHPGLDVLVTEGTGEAHLKKVVTKLPLSLALDSENAQALCEYADGLKGVCPRSSEIGTATAVSPLLNRPLYGKVYFVKNVRFNSKGQPIRTLPTLLVQLRGEINIDLRASSDVDDEGRLVTTFANVPDAAISGFRLQLRGGKHGILVVTHNQDVCRGKQVTDMESDGQNGKTHDAAVTMKTPCKARSARKAKARRGKARRHAASRAAGRR